MCNFACENNSIINMKQNSQSKFNQLSCSIQVAHTGGLSANQLAKMTVPKFSFCYIV